MNLIQPSIMQSIKPQYCELIAADRKTYEIRKTKPKIETPFKSYLYCTKDTPFLLLPTYSKGGLTESDIWRCGNGKVIGEYICDEIQEWVFDNETNSYDISDDDLALTCLTQEQLWEYGKGKTLYGYHISNLKIYDEPKELSDFYTICNKDDLDQCGDCKYLESWGSSYPCEDSGGEECGVDNKKPLTRPPQSWCYVTEVS